MTPANYTETYTQDQTARTHTKADSNMEITGKLQVLATSRGSATAIPAESGETVRRERRVAGILVGVGSAVYAVSLREAVAAEHDWGLNITAGVAFPVT